MSIRKLSAVAALLVPLALAAPVAGALADTTPATTPGAASHRVLAGPLLSFVPPAVGPLSVSLGATIIDGQVISPGVNVLSPGISLPPINWTPTF
jgi:hypothetical protein